MSNVINLNLLGQSIWYDNLERALLQDGTLKGMIERREIYGVTSNPSIFQKAIVNSTDYDAALQVMSWAGLDAIEMFYRLAIDDIQHCADLFCPYYDATHGADGFVSLEVNPNLAHDTQGTIDEALWLWRAVDRPNLMVKIPATQAGLPAITEAIAAGVNVNVTLIFSRKRYVAVMEAYLAGLEQRLAAGQEIGHIASVASFFVSRLETKADEWLEEVITNGGVHAEKARTLVGTLAVANTRLAYQDYEEIFTSKRFQRLAEAGAQKQRPLWASTGTKNPAYSSTKYVNELVARNTVNTLPPDTLCAFLAQGDPKITIDQDLDQAKAAFESLSAMGISLDEITRVLEDEGVQAFADSFSALIEAIEGRKANFLVELGTLSEPVAEQVAAFKHADTLGKLLRRDPTVWTDDPDGKAEIQKRLGWIELPSESRMLIAPLTEFAGQAQADGFTKVLLLGMGGSSLAPETIRLVFGDGVTGLDLQILDSTLPTQIRLAEGWVEYGKTLFIVASKSGTTSETLALFDYFWAAAEKVLGGSQPEHFIAITDPGSSLAKLGESLGFRTVFTANPNVGGRFSVLSHYGLVPAALMGIDLVEWLDRAEMAATRCARSQEVEENLGALLGAIIGVGQQQGKDKLTLLMDEILSPLSAWLEQLVAESSGKAGRGIVPIADEPGAPAEVYSADRLFVYFRQSGDLDDRVQALQAAGHPTITLDVPDVYDLAAQFYLWEFAVALACSVIGVNAFDQPDVQDSKTRTREKLAAYRQDGQLEESAPDWAQIGVRDFSASDGLDDCQTLAEVIECFTVQAGQGDYVAINAYLPRDGEHLAALQTLRGRILEQTGCATTLGFGPRFLHSTGQLHKGGADTGFFLQITQAEAVDLAIPDKDYSFGVLAQAQAQGDLEALQARGRRALQIHFEAGAALEF